MKVKGLDVLVQCAWAMSASRFVVIGIMPHLIEHAKRQAPSNVEFIPLVEQHELLRYYQRAKVYCQPSYSEGFPNSVCEAMLCGCIPVGSNVGGIPTAMGEVGFLVPHGDVQELSNALQQALHSQGMLGDHARSYIAQNFTLERREHALVRIIGEEPH
jgi:glycosyltransferase involved in cell wall biosynthesis